MTKDLTMAFGERLRRRRRHLAWSQRELAARIDGDTITQQYISQLEAGERNPSVVTVKRIADALDVSVAELMEDV